MDLLEKICPACNKSFKVNSNRKYQKTVCSKSCSHSYFKRRKTDNKKYSNCKVCSKEIKNYYSKKSIYCSVLCRLKDQKTDLLTRFEKGEINQRPTLRKILSQQKGYSCVGCGISEYNKKPITLQVNHIDGNCTNNLPSNLELICPNCHSQTNTFGGKNKGRGRKSLGVPLHF
jgi:hypothetical protein